MNEFHITPNYIIENSFSYVHVEILDLGNIVSHKLQIGLGQPLNCLAVLQCEFFRDFIRKSHGNK